MQIKTMLKISSLIIHINEKVQKLENTVWQGLRETINSPAMHVKCHMAILKLSHKFSFTQPCGEV